MRSDLEEQPVSVESTVISSNPGYPRFATITLSGLAVMLIWLSVTMISHQPGPTEMSALWGAVVLVLMTMLATILSAASEA